MAVFISDTIKKTDCINCRVAQASYGRFCSLCFFTTETNERIEFVLAEQRREIRRGRLIGHIVIAIGVLMILAALVYVRGWFE